MNLRLHDTLDGQYALVTGANRGIGAAIASELAALGATVYAGARDPETVTNTDHRPLRLDVTEESSIEAAIDRIRSETGALDVLVNNAGVYGPSGPLHEVEVDGIDITLATNLRGPILVTKHALPLMLGREGPRVVNVSSGSGQFAGGMNTGRAPYAISKAGLNALTASLHGQYAGRGLIANAVCPGWVRTDMGGSDAPRSPAKGAETPVWLARLKPGGPAGKFWRDEEVIEW